MEDQDEDIGTGCMTRKSVTKYGTHGMLEIVRLEAERKMLWKEIHDLRNQIAAQQDIFKLLVMNGAEIQDGK